jgi:hypothetical protein
MNLIVNRRCHGIDENQGQGLIPSVKDTGERILRGERETDS